MTDTANAQWEALAPHQGDWMKKALDVAGISAKSMAEYLGVEPETVSRWLNRKRSPSLQTLRLWAMRTGIPMSYLQTGIIPEDPDNGSRLGDLNSRPSHYKVTPIRQTRHQIAA